VSSGRGSLPRHWFGKCGVRAAAAAVHGGAGVGSLRPPPGLCAVGPHAAAWRAVEPDREPGPARRRCAASPRCPCSGTRTRWTWRACRRWTRCTCSACPRAAARRCSPARPRPRRRCRRAAWRSWRRSTASTGAPSPGLHPLEPAVVGQSLSRPAGSHRPEPAAAGHGRPAVGWSPSRPAGARRAAPAGPGRAASAAAAGLSVV